MPCKLKSIDDANKIPRNPNIAKEHSSSDNLLTDENRINIVLTNVCGKTKKIENRS